MKRGRPYGSFFKKKRQKRKLFCYFSNYKNNTYSCRNLQSTEKLKVIINYNLTTSRTFFYYHFSIYLPGLLFRYIYMCTYVYIHTMFLLCILFLNKIILYILFHNQPFLLTIYHELFSMFFFFSIFFGV